MLQPDSLRVSDTSVVARFLQVRSLIHDHLGRVEQMIQDLYHVEPTRRVHPTLISHVRSGFIRPGEGELWPVFFLTTIDLSVALCLDLTADRVASLGTTINGPQRIRQRGWEDWWGWEKPLAGLHTDFYELPAERQQDAILAWYTTNLEWLAGSGLLQKKSALLRSE
jgi:hypothetical protein